MGYYVRTLLKIKINIFRTDFIRDKLRIHKMPVKLYVSEKRLEKAGVCELPKKSNKYKLKLHIIAFNYSISTRWKSLLQISCRKPVTTLHFLQLPQRKAVCLFYN